MTKVSYEKMVESESDYRREMHMAVDKFIDEKKLLTMVVYDDKEEVPLSIVGLDDPARMGRILGLASLMLKLDPLSSTSDVLIDTFVKEGKDLLQKRSGAFKDVMPDTIEMILSMVSDDTTQFAFVALPPDGQALVLANIDVGAQLELLQDAIDNLKRIGQKT